MARTRNFPNVFAPGVNNVEQGFRNDDSELKRILGELDSIGAINLSDTKRQSVLSASVDASGNPNYLSTTGLTVSIDGSAKPVLLAFANGFDTVNNSGAVDVLDKVSSLVSSAWTLPANQTCYLYIDKDISTKLISYGYSLLPDLCRAIAPISPVLDQHYYNIIDTKMYRWNGSAWENKQRVFVAKAVTNASTIALSINQFESPTEIAKRSTGMKNLIINGGFSINQRGYATATAKTVGLYMHDRWKAGASGCTYTFTQLSSPLTTITITAGSLQQIIEGQNIVGGNYILSWSGTAQGRINGGSYGISPMIVTGLTAGSNVTTEFNTGTLGAIQFENGSIATQFEQRHIAQELMLCQRYYEISPYMEKCYNGSIYLVNWIFKTQKRAVPTLGNITGLTATGIVVTGAVLYSGASGGVNAATADAEL